MTLYPFVVGCDISKHHLDIHHSADGTTRRIANTADAVAAWIAELTDTAGLVVMEATGRYDAVLRRALAEHGIAHARVNPEQARHFARATGRRAKTDETDTLLAADLDAHLAWLDHRIAAFDRSIAETMRGDATLARQADLLRSAPGVGPVTAAVLLAQLPELGQIPTKAAAALAGLAPFNNDSGGFRGKRSVRGGRTRVRQALYMAALAATRSDTTLSRFYRRLRDAGKPPKLALIALARKLLTTLHAMLKQQTPFAA